MVTRKPETCSVLAIIKRFSQPAKFRQEKKKKKFGSIVLFFTLMV